MSADQSFFMIHLLKLALNYVEMPKDSVYNVMMVIITMEMVAQEIVKYNQVISAQVDLLTLLITVSFTNLPPYNTT